MGCHYHPNAFLMSCLLFIGTFLIAWHLKKFKAQSFFTNGVRGFISDFAVIIAILTMTAIDVWANVSNQIYLVTLRPRQLTQASFLQKKIKCCEMFDIFNAEIAQCRRKLDVILGTKVVQF